MFEKYLTITQLAEKLGITRQAIHKGIQEGRIKSEMVGHQHVIPKAEAERLLTTKDTKESR